jgi:hypothetical protein
MSALATSSPLAAPRTSGPIANPVKREMTAARGTLKCQVRATKPGGTVSVTAPTGPVRGLFCPRPWPVPPWSVVPSAAVRGPHAPGTRRPRTAAARNRASKRVRAGQRGVTRAERAGCKTVGSAYVGSNPTPATTCEDGPLAANSRLGGPFFLCAAMSHLVALRTALSRCPRTHSGRRWCPKNGRCAPSAVSRTATDGPWWWAYSGLTCAARPGLWTPAIALMASRPSATAPGTVCPCPGTPCLMSFAARGRLGAVPRRKGPRRPVGIGLRTAALATTSPPAYLLANAQMYLRWTSAYGVYLRWT